MNKTLAIFMLAATGIGVVLSLSALAKRGLTESQPSNIPPEVLQQMSPEEIRRLTMFQKRPLTSASEQEVKQAAINYTLAHSQFKVLSGTPEAIFARSIKAADLPSIGLGEINFIGEEPPLMLVVIRGNFDTTGFIHRRFSASNSSRQTPPRSTNYIAYVFDLKAGIPTLTTIGLTGEYFRNVLNDPNVPDASKLVDPKAGMPDALPGPKVPPAKKLPYGTTLPGEAK